MFDTNVFIEVRVDMVVGTCIDLSACPLNGGVPDIDIPTDVIANICETMMAVPEFVKLSASLEDLLLCCRTSCR